jgi:hypothetical protein
VLLNYHLRVSLLHLCERSFVECIMFEDQWIVCFRVCRVLMGLHEGWFGLSFTGYQYVQHKPNRGISSSNENQSFRLFFPPIPVPRIFPIHPPIQITMPNKLITPRNHPRCFPQNTRGDASIQNTHDISFLDS